MEQDPSESKVTMFGQDHEGVRGQTEEKPET